MAENKKIKTALVSVFHKDGLDELLKKLNEEGVKFLSTGGTQQFIESLGYECQKVEDVTTYPSILGGRVKTLHPKVFGGILARRENEGDIAQMKQYEIPEIDLVIVDLYPFEQTVASGASEADIIEKIDIGGISLIRDGAGEHIILLRIKPADHGRDERFGGCIPRFGQLPEHLQQVFIVCIPIHPLNQPEHTAAGLLRLTQSALQSGNQGG